MLWDVIEFRNERVMRDVLDLGGGDARANVLLTAWAVQTSVACTVESLTNEQ